MRTQTENIPPVVQGLFLHKILECAAQLHLWWCQALWFFAVHKCMTETTVTIFNMSHWFKDINGPSFVYTGREIFPFEHLYLFFFSVNTYKMGSFSSIGLLWEIHFIKSVSPFENTLNLYSTWRPVLIDVKGLVILLFPKQSLPTCRLTKLSCASGDEDRQI